MFYLTPAASEGYRSTLKPAAFRNSAPSANLSSQVIRQGAAAYPRRRR
ncbi:MAG: hypothetical protein ACLU9S_04630 [Oscillospiraceae bacterium]